MRRRDLLAGGVTLGLSAEAFAKDVEALTPREMRQAIRRLERELGQAEGGDFAVSAAMRHDLAAMGHDAHGEAGERLMRSSLRTLLVSDLVTSVPPANRQDPELHGLVERQGAEMDFAFLGTLSWLDSLGPQDHRAMRAKLRSSPELVMQVGEQIDEMAAQAGVGRRQRKRLQGMVSHLSWRMRNQPLDLVLKEIVDDATRFLNQGLDAGVADTLNLSAQDTERWEAELAAVTSAFASESANVTVADDSDALPPGAEPLRASRSDRLRRAALIQLLSAGICGVVGGGALAIGVALDNPVLIIGGLFPITGMVLLLLSGLITLAIAVVIAKQEKEELEALR